MDESDSDQFQNFFEEVKKIISLNLILYNYQEATYSRTGGVGRHLVDGRRVSFDGGKEKC